MKALVALAMALILFSVNACAAYDSGALSMREQVTNIGGDAQYNSNGYFVVRGQGFFEVATPDIPYNCNAYLSFAYRIGSSGQQHEDISVKSLSFGEQYFFRDGIELRNSGSFQWSNGMPVQLNQGANIIRFTGIGSDSVHLNYFRLENCLSIEPPHALPPEFSSIPNQEIRMNSPANNRLIDLFGYVSDPDTENSQLSFQIASQSNSSLISCSIRTRYLRCDAPAANRFGTSEITVRATDPENNHDTETFTINVSQLYAPGFRNIPDQRIEKNSPAVYHLLDLWDYASDYDNPDRQLSFDVLSQSNPSLISCALTDIHFLGCSAAANETGASYITVKVKDPDMQYDTETFKVIVFDAEAENHAPAISGLPDKTFGLGSGPKSKMLDIRNYASDDQTPVNDLNYQITAQSSTEKIQCFIEDRYFLSCFSPQQTGYTDITIQAKDSFGRTDDDTMRINITQGQDPDNIVISSKTSTVFMGRNDSVGVSLTVRNNSSERKCVSLSGETDSSYVEASPTTESLCLNPNEQANITLNIRTIDAKSCYSYKAELEAESDSGIATYGIAVKVGCTEGIGLIPYSRSVCSGSREELSVKVKNNSQQLKEIRLWADNEMLLPVFSPSRITLDSQEERYVTLSVYAGAIQPGSYNVSLFAETGEDYVKERFSVRVSECETPAKPSFIVDFSGSCVSIDKNKSTSISFKVRNLLDEEQLVHFAVSSELGTELGTTSRLLEEKEEKTFRFDVNSSEAEEGSYDVTLYVWSDSYSFEKAKCVTVRKSHALSIEWLKNNLEIEQCKSEVFTLLAINNGDYNEQFRISVPSAPSGISVAVSDANFYLNKKSEKEVYINVSAAEDAQLNTYELDVLVRAGSRTITEKLRFSVVEKREDSEGPLTVESFPMQAVMEAGKTRNLVVVLKNNGSEAIENIRIELIGLPNGFESDSVRNISIPAGETKQASVSLKAGEGLAAGNYEATLRISGSGILLEKEIGLVVTEESKEGEAGFITGLIALGGSALLALVMLAIVIALIVFITRVVREGGNNQPVWLRR